MLSWPAWLAGLRRALVPSGRLWLSTPNYGEPWLPAIESTVLELVARRSGFSRRHLHPTRFRRASLARGLSAAGFEAVEAQDDADPARDHGVGAGAAVAPGSRGGGLRGGVLRSGSGDPEGI